MRSSSGRETVHLRFHHSFEGVATERALLLQVETYFLHLFGRDQKWVREHFRSNRTAGCVALKRAVRVDCSEVRKTEVWTTLMADSEPCFH